MPLNLSDVGQLVSAFAGVNAGYQGEETDIRDPSLAAALIREQTAKLGINATVYPGRVVYDTSRGCPVGGEAIGVIFVPSASSPSLETWWQLKNNLRQTTLSVIAPSGSGIQTEGFVFRFNGNDLNGLALKWQQVSAETGAEFSGAVFDADGQIFAQAEANPARVKDVTLWKQKANDLIARLSNGGKPLFRSVNYTYLKAPVL